MFDGGGVSSLYTLSSCFGSSFQYNFISLIKKKKDQFHTHGSNVIKNNASMFYMDMMPPICSYGPFIPYLPTRKRA